MTQVGRNRPCEHLPPDAARAPAGPRVGWFRVDLEDVAVGLDWEVRPSRAFAGARPEDPRMRGRHDPSATRDCAGSVWPSSCHSRFSCAGTSSQHLELLSLVPKAGIEPATRGFSMAKSTPETVHTPVTSSTCRTASVAPVQQRPRKTAKKDPQPMQSFAIRPTRLRPIGIMVQPAVVMAPVVTRIKPTPVRVVDGVIVVAGPLASVRRRSRRS